MGWLDIIGIGIDAAQYNQLAKTREQIKRMEDREFIQAVNREILEALRNLIFASQKSAEALEDHLEENPQPVYVGAKLLAWRFEDLELTPEVFPDFSDKEYVHKAKKAIANLTKSAKAKLQDPEIKRADACVKAIVHMPLLEDMVAWKESEEVLESTKADWNTENTKNTLFKLATVGILLVGIPLACFMYLFEEVRILACLGGLGATIVSIIFLIFSSSKKHKDLKALRIEHEKNVPPRGKQEILIGMFGELSTEEANRLLEKNNATIKQVMGELASYEEFLLTG